MGLRAIGEEKGFRSHAIPKCNGTPWGAKSVKPVAMMCGFRGHSHAKAGTGSGVPLQRCTVLTQTGCARTSYEVE